MSKFTSYTWRLLFLASFVLVVAAPFRWHG